MTTPNTTTELSAVNTMLSVVNESPVNSLADPSIAEAALAKSILDEVNREVQSEGWNFNTDECYVLLPDVDGNIFLPNNTLRVSFEPFGSNQVRAVARGDRLYDKLNHTFTWDTDVKASVRLVSMLEWDQIPEPVRRYITIRSARELQKRYGQSAQLDGFTADSEASAYLRLQQFELEEGQYNIFQGPDLAHDARR